MRHRQFLPHSTAACCLALALAATCASRLGAEEQSGAPMPRVIHLDPGDARAHISSILRSFVDAPHPGAIDARLARMTVRASSPDRVVLRVYGGTTAADIAAIAASGARVRSVHPSLNEIVLEATLDQVDAVARLPGVHAVRLALRPFFRSAPTPDEADTIILTNQIRAKYGVTGAGRTIGIISDSINMTSYMHGPDSVHVKGQTFTLTGSPPQVAGLLPASVLVASQSNPSDDNTDEGEAMMENCYSLAPGAAFAFGAANDSDGDMVASINALVSAGCTVICDDVGFPDEPMFQDGPIAQACESAITTSHAIYCSAAGNDADAGTIMPFVDVIPGANDVQANGVPNAKDIHNWGIGGAAPGFLPLTIQSFDTVTIVLEWNQPCQNLVPGPGSQADFDLYLTSSPNFNNILTASDDTQGTASHPSGDPIEAVQWTNLSSQPITVYVAVDHVAGITNCLLRLEYHTEAGVSSPFYGSVLSKATIYGHPAAADVLAIAAVPEFDPSTPESFTGKGGWGANGLQFFFDTAGNPLTGAPVLRNKPDVTAPDGCSTGNVNSYFDPFFGTSDATPQVAAAAALAWQARPALTNAELINALRGTAVDITAAPASSGPDAWTGFGLVDGYAAAGVPVTGITTASTGTLAHGAVTITVTFAAAVTVTGTPTILLNTAPSESATYVSGSGTSTLTFSYAIQVGDTSAALAPASIQALQLPGGATIVDTSANTNPADLALPQAAGAASGTAGPIGSVAIYAIGPSVAITPTPTISNHPGFSFSIVFSHAVTSFTTANCTLGNCVAGTLTTNSSGLSYTLAVTASAQGAVTVSVPANAVQDVNALGNLAGSASATFDTTPPTLVISGLTSMQSNAAALYTFTFSKNVSGFVVGDVSFTDGSAGGALGGSGKVYTLNVDSGPAGIMSITVAPNAGITDAAGNSLGLGASILVTVVDPPSSNKKCGLGGIGAVLPMLWWLRRRRQARSS